MKKSTKFCIVCVIVMIISFFVLAIMDKLIGGNATNGKIENGIYWGIKFFGLIIAIIIFFIGLLMLLLKE